MAGSGICGNGADEDCSGSDLACPKCVDSDGDGYGANCVKGADCNDANSNIHPGAADTCGNGIDEDW